MEERIYIWTTASKEPQALQQRLAQHTVHSQDIWRLNPICLSYAGPFATCTVVQASIEAALPVSHIPHQLIRSHVVKGVWQKHELNGKMHLDHSHC